MVFQFEEDRLSFFSRYADGVGFKLPNLTHGVTRIFIHNLERDNSGDHPVFRFEGRDSVFAAQAKNVRGSFDFRDCKGTIEYQLS